MSVDRISFMLIMRIVVRDGIAIVLTNFSHKLPAGLKVCSHNIHYASHTTQIVNN